MYRSKRMSWLAVGILALGGALAGLAHAAAPASADEAAIRAQTASWEKAYNGGDAKGVAAQYAEDALLLPPGAPGVRGRAAILSFFTKDIADSKAAVRSLSSIPRPKSASRATWAGSRARTR